MEIKLAKHYGKSCRDMIENTGKEPELSIPSFGKLNDFIVGLPKNRLTVIGARTSQGKTDIVVQMMIDLLNKEKTIMYLGFEMKQEELLTRILCNKYKIPNIELSVGNHHKYTKQMDDFFDNYLDKIKLIPTDHFAKDQKDLIEFLDKLKNVPDVIIVDYIQAVSQGLGKGKEFIDKYILGFRNMCIERNFSGIMVSQLNRATQERKNTTPQLHDLKGSGYLEEISDVCLLCEWVGKEDDKDNSKYIINIAKNRAGRTGWAELKYYPQYSMFTDKNADLEQATNEILEQDFDEEN